MRELLKTGCGIGMSFLLVCFLLAACGGNSNPNTSDQGASDKVNSGQGAAVGKAPETTDPAKVVAYSLWQDFDDTYWNNVLIQPVKKKFPNIDVEIVKPGKNNTEKLQQMISAGETPDVVIGDIANALEYNNLGYDFDMTSMIKKYNLDLSKMDPNALNYVRAVGNGKITGIPYSSFFMSLYYNKDLFDKFGVSYPQDGITFEAVLDLAKKLTREEQGTQYIGFDHNSVNFLGTPIATGYFDPKTGKANLSTPEWKKAYGLLTDLIAIPGNRFPQDKDKVVRWHNPDFFQTRHVAMAGLPNIIPAGLQLAPDLNWDMTTYPTFEGYPNTTPIIGGRALFMNPKSKVLESAFKVVLTSLSEDSQIAVSRNGEQPTILTKSAIDAFCADLPYSKGKNVKSVFKYKQNWFTNPTLYDGTANPVVFSHSVDLYKGEDINTVIRETEEDIDKKVNALKNAQQ
ncbi:MAG: family 1 extracellular solute-binding protein [Paenibacillaceae bacterium]|nr:family 1 extracellular solute-binding protein [Paenibacillaceae bacterium]